MQLDAGARHNPVADSARSVKARVLEVRSRSNKVSSANDAIAIAAPEYPWERLRNEQARKYESYVDLDAEWWAKMRWVVNGSRARLHVGDATAPTLIVNDLKLPPASGAIGLWIGPGSKGYFKSLKVALAR